MYQRTPRECEQGPDRTFDRSLPVEADARHLLCWKRFTESIAEYELAPATTLSCLYVAGRTPELKPNTSEARRMRTSADQRDPVAFQ